MVRFVPSNSFLKPLCYLFIVRFVVCGIIVYSQLPSNDNSDFLP